MEKRRLQILWFMGFFPESRAVAIWKVVHENGVMIEFGKGQFYA